MKRYDRFRVILYDLGGGPRIRDIWKNYFALIHGIIFVIDSSDISRILEVKDVVEEVVANDKIAGKPILVSVSSRPSPLSLTIIPVQMRTDYRRPESR